MATFIEIEGIDSYRRFINLDRVTMIEGCADSTMVYFGDGEPYPSPANLAAVLYRVKQAGATVAEMPRTRRGPEGGE